MKKTSRLFAIPYALWVFLFVLAPVALIIFKSFFDIHGNFTLANYQTYFNSPNITYLRMSFNSIFYAGIITFAAYIEIPFMILPIFNALDDLDKNLINASRDLGATSWQTFSKVIFPLSMNGVRSGVQAVFIPSLSLFMLTRLIGGNRVITLGTAIEQHFLTTQNWGMGSTIGVVLILAMLLIMWMTKERKK